MSIAAADIFGLAEKRLGWVDQRQSVLAQNIANVNTPGFAAKDVTPFKDVLAQQASWATGTGGTFGAALKVSNAPGGGQSLNGNAVVLDEQLEKVAETDGAHQLAMNLIRKYTGLFRTAIGRS